MENPFKSKLKLVRGTRFTSFLFIAASMAIAAGILFAANMYYNIDTGEVVTEEIQRITGVLRATAGAIVGGTATQNPTSGYSFEVVGQTRLATTTVATGRLELTAAEQVLRFTGGVSGYYVEFKANTTATSGQSITYTLPAAKPTNENYVLTSDPSGVLSWQSVSGVGAGDITAVGDCATGECFTQTGTAGSSLWFYNSGYRTQLTIPTLTANYTITLPAQTGTVALGTSTANYVAYWTNTNTLAGEAQLATSRGGTGANSSAWNGMVRVVNGSWGAVTGTAGYAAYWSDANTVAAEQYLGVSRGGTGRGSWTQWGVLYAATTGSLTNTGAGTTYQILTANTSAAPSWRNISDLVFATNGLTITGTATTTLKLGGTLTENTTITQGNYNLIFALTGTGDFIVKNDTGTDIFTVTDDDRILFKTYPLAESGKQVLREMIPIFGFDLPAQTATTSFVKISRTISGYPFSSPSTGSNRVHKFVIRYTDDLPTASSSDWQVATSTGVAFSSFTLAGSNNPALDSGKAAVTGAVSIPTDSTPWWLEVRIPPAQSGKKIKVFQIFLAAYDQIQ